MIRALLSCNYWSFILLFLLMMFSCKSKKENKSEIDYSCNIKNITCEKSTVLDQLDGSTADYLTFYNNWQPSPYQEENIVHNENQNPSLNIKLIILKPTDSYRDSLLDLAQNKEFKYIDSAVLVDEKELTEDYLVDLKKRKWLI